MNTLTKKTQLFLTLLALLLSNTITVSGGNSNNSIYVSPNGEDLADNGTLSNPYRTISYALENITEGKHYTIYLDSGEYIINDQIELPVMVDLIGAGVNKTILKADEGFHYPDPDGGYKNVLIYLFKGIGKQEIAHFTIDGDNKQLFGGLGIRVRQKVYVHNLYIKETYYAGIFASGPSNCVFHSIKLENCAWGSTNYCSGALNMGYHINNTDFHDFEIIEGINNPSDEWGYAVKHQGTGVDLRNVRFFNSTFNINPIGLWWDGNAPNIAVEYWKSSLYDCEIFNCQTNANFSLVGSESMPGEYQNFPIRVFNNTFDRCESHAIEASMDNVEIDQNYFTNSKVTIVSYNPESNYKNWNIHHNIFTDNNKKITNAAIVRNKGGLTDLTFANNTCFITNSSNNPIVRVEAKKSVNINITNNIIYKDYNTTPENIFKTLNDAEISDITLKNNLLYNYKIPDCNTCESANNIVDELPGLRLTGDQPLPYFQVTDNSNLIDAGLEMNYPYLGESNDIGAQELIIGAGTVPEVTIEATINTASSVLNVNVEATDSNHGISKIEVYADQHLLAETESNTLNSSYEIGVDSTYFIKAFAYNSKGYMQAAYLTINSIDWVTGIQSLTNNESISIYPNPVKDFLMIDLKDDIQIENISLYTLDGKKMFFKNLAKKKNKVEIKISHLKSGIYMLDIGMVNRGRLVKKIIIE